MYDLSARRRVGVTTHAITLRELPAADSNAPAGVAEPPTREGDTTPGEAIPRGGSSRSYVDVLVDFFTARDDEGSSRSGGGQDPAQPQLVTMTSTSGRRTSCGT
jgi:hypothetical protein